MAVRRQATIAEPEYDVFSSDLMDFELQDIHVALSRIASVPRRDGETAFPEIATVTLAVRAATSERKASERIERERRAEEEYNANAARQLAEDRANPEALEREIAAIAERLNMDRKKPEISTEPQMMTCPHCSKDLPVNVNIRFWTSGELRRYADVLDEAKERKHLDL